MSRMDQPTADDVTLDLLVGGVEPTHENLMVAIAAYPQHRDALVAFFANLAVQTALKDEATPSGCSVEQFANIGVSRVLAHRHDAPRPGPRGRMKMFDDKRYDAATGHYKGDLSLYCDTHSLPATLASVGGSLYLRHYAHPLPVALASVEGDLSLYCDTHPLPAALVSVGGDLSLYCDTHPLPAALVSVGGDLYLRDYEHPLPAALASVGGNLYLDGYAHPLPAALIEGMNTPVVPQIDAAILAAVEAGALRMANWHTCGTTHCRGGWAINLAGEAGYALEERVGSEGAAALIYEASRPGVMRPDFYASDADAMADLRRCAERAGE